MEKIPKRLLSLAPSSFSEVKSNKSSEAFIDHAQTLIRRSPRNVVSLGTCSKFCAVTFVIGVVVGYTLKRRVRRWASKLLKKLKDD